MHTTTASKAETATALTESLRAELEDDFRGALIGPDDPHYDGAREVFNAMIDKRPALIAKCLDAADVLAGVEAAKACDALLAVRGGGHNGAGLGVADDALVLDLSEMRGIRVDPIAQTVRVEGGALWRDVDHATHRFGLAVPSGTISSTGVAGLTLGGGIGHLTRRHGLTIDNLLEADVILADGRLVTASASEHPDLFWALRGGGGNFGVVTSFLFKAHEVSTVQAGPTLWPLERGEEVMERYGEFIASAPRDLNGFFTFLTVPVDPQFPEHLHGQRMCGVMWCHIGTAAEADRDLAPMRALAPEVDNVGEVPFPAFQSAFDAAYAPGHQWYWRGDFVNELTSESIAEYVKHGSQLPSELSTMHLYPVDGAVHEVADNETAFSYRDARWSQVIVGVDPHPAKAPDLRDWAVSYWEAMHPHSAGGSYVNFLMEEGAGRVRATYGANHARLTEVKRRYDPDNLFRVNQNIDPADRSG